MKKLKIGALVKSLFLLFFILGNSACKDNPSKEKAVGAQADADMESAENSTPNFGGLALYTLRDAMGGDAKETLKAVSDAG